MSETNPSCLARAAALLPHREPDPALFKKDTPAWHAELRRLNRVKASLTHNSWPFKIEAFRLFYSREVASPLRPLTQPEISSHNKIISEEYNEFMDAMHEGDLIEMLDGGLDLIYTVLGALSHAGFSPREIDEAMDEIHASNMTKADDEGNPILSPDGKILKGPSYLPVDLRRIVGDL